MSAAETRGEDGAPGPGVLVALGRTMTLVVERLNEEKERAPCLAEQETKKKMWYATRRITLDLVMMGWGLGTWLGVNGLYVPLPLLVQSLPEGWALPTSMVLAVQLANIGVAFYALLKRLLPRLSDAVYIYCLLAIGTLALTLNAFLYKETLNVAGTERSVAFITLTFFAALVGCTSSVLFYPYLRHYRDVYLATYLVGEGLSGFIPSILALIQGIGGDADCIPVSNNATTQNHTSSPRFDSMVFFLLLASLSALSLVSFTFVDKWVGFLSERVKAAAVAKEDESADPPESLLQPSWVGVLLMTVGLNALMNGVLPSIQSYSCLPYGSRAYHLAVTMSAMANPAACLAGVWLRPLGARALAALLVTTGLPLGFMLSTSLIRPVPPLQHTPLGEALVVLSWVFVSACISYARMWVYGWARRGGARGMRVCGAVTQAGSALGSLLLFLLVNYTHLFTQAASCPPAFAS